MHGSYHQPDGAASDSAAFSALFGTPMAAAVFALEVVSVGGLNYPIYGIIIPETDTQRNMRRAGHGVRLRRCRTVISKAWMD